MLPDSAVRDRINELLKCDLPLAEIPFRFGTTGWVVDSVPLALCCAESILRDVPLTSVLAQAIELGGDTDTIASIAGQIAGTAVGFDAVHWEHFSGVRPTEDVAGIAARFADFVTSQK